MFAFGQNEQAPMVQKDLAYKNWTFKNLGDGGETDLRKFADGKKLVMVAYWAPWCPNWKHDVDLVRELDEKYRAHGLSIIGVGEYATTDQMNQHIRDAKLKFPMVYESTTREARTTTTHYAQRVAAGDTRKWGSPWYVFFTKGDVKDSGEVLVKDPMVINGEMTRPEVEAFIKKKLGIDK